MGQETERNRGGVRTVGGVSVETRDSFSRPDNATAYAAYDVIAADTNDTDTTALRGLELARLAGGGGYITSVTVAVNQANFTPASGLKLHLFNTATPTTALAGDNSPFVEAVANIDEWVATITLSVPALSGGSGADMVRITDDTLRVPFKCAWNATTKSGDTKLYYRLETLSGVTPAALKTFEIIVRADLN